jgi:hypothetical protein
LGEIFFFLSIYWSPFLIQIIVSIYLIYR